MQQWQPRQTRPRKFRVGRCLRHFRRGRLLAVLLGASLLLFGMVEMKIQDHEKSRDIEMLNPCKQDVSAMPEHQETEWKESLLDF